MKLFALLCIIGFAAASSSVGPLKWTPGTTYRFDYEGRQLTGLPQLSQQYSGIGIRCQVELKVGEDRQFGITIQNPRYVRVNDELRGHDEQVGGNNWRNLVLPSYSEVPEDIKNHLASPVILKFGRIGEFQSMVVSQDEPEWTVNFKKALAALFQTKYESGYQPEQEKNTVETIYGITEQSGDDSVTFWKTQEESIDGTCDVTYQVNEIPSYMMKDLNEIPRSERESGEGQYYEIVKTRDVNSCSKRSSFSYYKPGSFRCPSGNCEGMWGRTSMTRYIAQGSRNNLRIKSIINEGELTQNLFGMKSEQFLTGVRQVLNVTKQDSSSAHLNGPQNGIKIENLLYQYTRNTEAESSKNPEQLVPQSLLHQTSSAYKSLPRNILTTGGSKDKHANPSKLVPQVKKLFQEIVNEDLFDVERIPEKQISLKALSLARAFSMLDQPTIQSIYNELKSQFSEGDKRETFKNIFFDTLIMGGTGHNIALIKELMERGEMNNFQAISIFAFLPHYVMTPTKPTLENLYELVRSERVSSNEIVHSHAVLGFTTLLERACVSDNRNTSYPTFVYGEFCNPDSEIILVKWIPYLQQQISQSQGPSDRRNLYIVALSLLSHKNVLPIVVPLIENNQQSNSEQNSRLQRTLAINALGNVGRRYPDLVSPLIFSIFNNQAENTEVRIAALNVLLRTNPTMSIFQRIAESTWRETDEEVRRAVTTTLYSLSRQEDFDAMGQGEGRGQEGLQRKAYLVYSLIKPAGGRFPSSASVYDADYLRTLGAGYRQLVSWTGSKDSVVPSSVSGRIMYYLDRYQFSPLDFNLRMRGTDNVVKKIVEVLTGKSQGQNGEEQVKEQIHQEWRQVIEKLRIESREDSSSEGALFLNFFENSPMFHSFQASSSEMLHEKISKVLKNPSHMKKMLQQENNVNWQKMVDVTPQEFNIPSDMGFPIVVEIHMPITVSLRGQMQANLENKLKPSLTMNVHSLFTAQMTGWVGTISPFTQENVVTAVDKLSVINFPAQFNINADSRSGRFSVKMKLNSQVTRPVDIFHFHVHPYTVAQNLWNLQPMPLSQNAKPMKSGSPLQTKSAVFGEYLGLNMKSIIRTESTFVDLRSMVQKFQMYNYNPLNVARFGWAAGALSGNGLPSLRRHEVSLQYDPSSSSTKEIDFVVKVSYATKQKGQEVKFHSVDTDERTQSYQIVSHSAEESNTEHKMKVKTALEKQGIESGSGLNLHFSAIIGGGQRGRSVSYNLNIVAGNSQSTATKTQQKWDIELKDQQQDKSICLKGQMELPTGRQSVWDLQKIRSENWDFQYHNKLSWGNKQCDASSVQVNGNSRSSEKQKDYSKKSPEAKLLEKLMSKGEPSAKLFELKEKVRLQASGLDETDFVIQYSNVPSQYMVASRWFNEGLKALWWPNMVINPVSQQSESGEGASESHKYRFIIDSQTKTFNLDITRPNEEIQFKHIRMPYPFTYIFPVPAIRNGLRDVVSQSITGKSAWYPKCEVEGERIKTFDNVTSRIPADGCFHLLAADCSQQKQFAVLLREFSQTKQQEVKLFLGRTKIVLTREGRRGQPEIQVNGTRIAVNQEPQTIRDSRGEIIAVVQLTNDNVLALKSQLVNIYYNGYKADLEAVQYRKGQLCGLCGDANNQKKVDLRGPQKCVYSTPETFAASYRVDMNEEKCQPLPNHVKEQLNRETEQCVKYQEISSKVEKSFKSQTGSCTKYRHEITERPGKLCFSRKPIPECSARCQSDATIEAKVSFTCMPKGPAAQRYAEKIQEGQVIPGLENLPEDFSFKIALPRSCRPVAR